MKRLKILKVLLPITTSLSLVLGLLGTTTLSREIAEAQTTPLELYSEGINRGRDGADDPEEHAGFNQPPAYNKTDKVGAGANDIIRYVLYFRNGSDSSVTNPKVIATLPIPTSQSGDKYLSYRDPWIAAPEGWSISFSNDGGASFNYTPEPNNRNVDDLVTHVKFELEGTLQPTEESLTAQIYVKALDIADNSLIEGISMQPVIYSDEYPNGFVGNQVITRLITKPEFNIGEGEDNFYTGTTNGEEPNWYDPVEGATTQDTVWHRLYIHNYTYETIAEDITATVMFPTEHSNTTFQPNSTISASYADTVADTLTVNMADNQEETLMKFVEDSVRLLGSPMTGNQEELEYQYTYLPKCTGGNEPCYEYADSTATLSIHLPDQRGCSPYIMQVIFKTNFEVPPPPPPERKKDFSVVKVEVSSGTYQIGNEVQFRVRITNTGEEEFDVVYFLDEYDKNELRFSSATLNYKAANGNIIRSLDITNSLYTSNGTLYYPDLTELVGENFKVGETYEMYMTFIALAESSNACNRASAEAEEIEKFDEVCVPITKPPELPKTDM